MSENLIMVSRTNKEEALKMAKNPAYSKFKILKLFGSFVAIRPFEGDDNTIIVSIFDEPDKEGNFYLENLFKQFITFLFFSQRNIINFLADIGIEKNENLKIIFPISKSVFDFFGNNEKLEIFNSSFNSSLEHIGVKLDPTIEVCIEFDGSNYYYITEGCGGDDYVINKFVSSDIKEIISTDECLEDFNFFGKIINTIINIIKMN